MTPLIKTGIAAVVAIVAIPLAINNNHHDESSSIKRIISDISHTVEKVEAKLDSVINARTILLSDTLIIENYDTTIIE